MGLRSFSSLNFHAIFFFFLTISLLKPNAIIGANETDRVALLAFKLAILQDPYGALSSWNDSLHFCQWDGVTCNDRRERVIALNLTSKGLVGYLSPYIGNMSFLMGLWLVNNTLGGEISPEVGRLSKLQQLDLRANSFEGEIPINISQCSDLLLLALSNNKLIEKIPKELGSLSKLRNLQLHFNNLTGEIPNSFGNLTSLKVLSLLGNNLVGTLPDSLGELKNLSQLTLGANHFSGVIPPSLYNLSLINLFSISYNQFHGTLPPELGLMFPHLEWIQLGGNQFTGPLPHSFSNTTKLRYIDLAINNFTMQISIDFGRLQNLVGLSLGANNLGSGEPDEMNFISSLANCSNLQVLELGTNQLRGVLPYKVSNFSTQLFYLSIIENQIYGKIPSWIFDLSGLNQILLSNNEFNDSIPTNIGNLWKLQRLGLDSNKLLGELPPSIGNLSVLSELDLANNFLQGNIPSSVGNCQTLILLDLSQNNFSGTIPEEILGIPTLSILLNLSHNYLFGELPSEVGELINLSVLDVSENKLFGEIPNSLGSCINLGSLYLDGNVFQGAISPSLSSLKGIQYLDLSRNNLSGEIPKFLENFSLMNLNLSYNDFEGNVPTEGVFRNASAISIVGNIRLCGGISDLQLPKCAISGPNRQKKLRTHFVVLITIASIILIIMVLSSLYCWFKKKRIVKILGTFIGESLLNVSYENLLKATNRFSSENLVGAGNFGMVYKGILNEEIVVAVKVFNLQRQGASQSFLVECEALRNVRHRNIIKIITSCSSIDFQRNDFKALVYEFMPNGSLNSWLHPSQEAECGPNECRTLKFQQRIKIAVDVACALEYLHHSYGSTIIHCDLKPNNILLDGDMVAHIGDFGQARLLLQNSDQSNTGGIRGTIGYTAPEYGMGSEMSTKGDVYSYGILILEMITGKRPTDPLFVEGLNLHDYAKLSLPNRVLEIVDPILLNNIEENASSIAANDNQIHLPSNGNIKECLISLVKVGVACSMESTQDRIDIWSVVRELDSIKKILRSEVT
ncbi:hypothetical protein LguiB_006297 [Lonicera macranthoides]